MRLGRPGDREALSQLRAALWPDASAEEHARELEAILAGTPPGILPYVAIVAEDGDGAPIGFAEVSLRSYADGCDPAQPAGYLEGWFVAEEHRRRGIGAELLRAAEAWARAQGCTELASDAELENMLSHRVHEALGFETVGRCVQFRKAL